MIERALLVVVVVAVVSLVAMVARRRRPDAPTRTGFAVPDQLDRADFDRPDAPWLVAVFTSATCSTCAPTWEKARQLASDDVAVVEVEAGADAALHARYRIEVVPLVVVADHHGVTRTSFLGPPSTSELWAGVATVRAEASG